MMTHATTRKAGLFLGCAGLALAGSLTLAPQRAAAQAFQATPTVVQGAATIDRATPGQDTITVDTMDTVIDWVPDEVSGSALTFLPAGNTAIFQNNIANSDFAVLNRILPSTNGDVVVMNGAVISQIQNVLGTTPGGNVAFYSPTGILVGSTATFDVGRLVLTSLSPDIGQLGAFWAGGGQLDFTGVTGDVSQVQINAGATITSTEEGGYFAVVAPGIIMSGLADINGSTVYAAGEQVSLTYNAGLFDISIPIGSSVATSIFHDGTTTGPASTGAGDEHVIYGVARAAANPMTVFFSGNLGFQPAAVAGVENGDIILAANYDVLGRFVDGDTIDNGINAVFDGDSATSTTQTDLLVDNITVTSDLLAIGSDFTQVNGSTTSSSFAGDLLIVGRGQAILNSNVGLITSVDGDLLITASDYGATGSGGLGIDPDATAGSAFIDPVGGTVTVGGDVTITADAVAGTDTDTSVFGAATAGSAQIFATGGTIDIVGNSILTATASQRGGAINDGGLTQGGFTRIGAQGGGTVTLQGDAALSSDAIGGDVSAGGVSSGIDAIAGTASVEILAGVGGGAVTIQGDLDLDANAVGGAGSAAGAGSTATAGAAFVGSQDPLGTVSIDGSVSVQASAFGGDNAAVGGTGGNANGGDAQVYTLQGGIVNIGVDATARGDAFAGDGNSGGDAIAGIGGVFGDIGTITIGSDVYVSAIAFGGNADVGFGGQGGFAQGGQAFVQANGSLAEDATITIGGDVRAFVSAGGGNGGAGDGSAIAPGAGGEGRAGIISTPNPLRPAFGNGAYVLAQGDRGFLAVGGIVAVTSIGQGGAGGTAGIGQIGGAGGDGFGGTAQAGSFTGNGDGSVAAGIVDFGDVTSDASAFGGVGGADGVTGGITGQGGDALAGDAFLTARVGVVNANILQLNAVGQGGLGGTGGNGTGGSTGLLVEGAGTANVTTYTGDAQGLGGDGLTGTGGTGQGGTAFIGFQGGTANVTGDVSLNANGSGGNSTNADGGAGIGGLADIADFTGVPGSGTVGGASTLSAVGFGGDTLTAGFNGGAGTGGTTYLLSQPGSTLDVQDASLSSQGRGGDAIDGIGGTGTGGITYVVADGIGASVSGISIQMDAGAFGGTSLDGTGGSAIGGTATFEADNSGSISITGNAVANTVTTAGNGSIGGDSTGGESVANAFDSGSLSAGLLDINAGADSAASSGGAITGGSANLEVRDGSISVTQLVQTANADAVAGGTATGGSISLTVSSPLGGGASADASQTFFEADANGGDTNIAGDFDIAVEPGGQFTTDDFFASAQGTDGITDPSALFADGGNILITNSATIGTAGVLEFETANGGSIIGGTSPADLTAIFLVSAGDTISILGDDDNRPSFGALSMTLQSPDIDIPLGARFGAVDLTLISSNTSAPVLIGGNTSGAGYTLTQDEAARIEAGAVTFIAPALGSDPARAPDVELSDLTIAGSQDDGPSSVSLITDGIVSITGLVNYTFAAPTDTFQIIAAERIQFVTSSPSATITDLDGFPVDGAGQIYMNDADGEISGSVFLAAPSIFAAEADLLAQIIDDPNLPGLADLLSDPGGRSEPSVTIAANRVSLIGEDFIYFQNVGTSALPSAIAVGPASTSSPGLEANLFLAQSSDSIPNLMEAIVFGLQVNPDGSFTSGNDFFPLAEFNMDPSGHFTETSALNGCFIVTGQCSGISGGPIEEAPPINNPAIVEEPVVGEPTEPGEEESDSEFGMDFPGLIDAPVVTEEGVIDDPVTSGGDSALYAGGDEDEDEEEADDAE